MRPRLLLAAALSAMLTATGAGACTLPANAASLMAAAGTAINGARENAGRKALRRDARLDQAAQRHACWMSTTGRFTHSGEGDTRPSQRIAATGYKARLTSENIAKGQRTADEVISDWMASKGHRENILRQTVVDYGVGVALLSGRPVWVVIFASHQ
ncbi:MAG: CAP domain-containing protein [Maritimibacter harenae]